MKNLEQFGLVALNATELQQVQGGSWIDIAIDLIKGALGGDKKPIVVECQGPCKVTIPQ